MGCRGGRGWGGQLRCVLGRVVSVACSAMFAESLAVAGVACPKDLAYEAAVVSDARVADRVKSRVFAVAECLCAAPLAAWARALRVAGIGGRVARVAGIVWVRLYRWSC